MSQNLNVPVKANYSLIVAILFVLCFASGTQARTITESEARRTAINFFTQKNISSAQTITPANRMTQTSPGMGASAVMPLYIYNSGKATGGFVVVSGDDRAIPVLGYSDTGTYDPANVPPAMQEWLNFLAYEIATLGDDNGTTYYTPQRALGSGIAPLLPCNWDQGEPYNALLPNTNGGNKAVTGCVATAMAQVMRFYNWPQNSTAIPDYTTKSQSIYMPSLSATSFEWSSMKNNYLANDNGTTAGNAVAKLMLYCAQAVNMDFQDTQSGGATSSASTNHIPAALKSYFNYANSVHYIKRVNYSRSDWENTLYKELKAGRPVIYRGETMKGGGHAFICDGYDATTGLFHINWGWSGGSNGYYALSALTTSVQGTGSSEGTEGYAMEQAMVIGITPNNGQTVTPKTAMTFSQLKVTTTTYSRSGTSSNFNNVSFEGRFSNSTGETRSFVSGWALYKGNTRVSILTSESNRYVFDDLPDNYGRTSTFTLSFGANLAAGTYRLVPISKLKPIGTWEICEGGNVNYVEAKVTTTTLTLTPYGTAGNASYTVNNVTFNGYKHPGKTIEVIANVTNKGTTTCDKIFLFSNGVKTTVEVSEIEPGETGNIKFFYRSKSTGTKTITLSLNEDGSSPIATRPLTIDPMPAANLSMAHSLANLQVTSSGPNILNSNSASVTTTVTNKGSSTYDEEVLAYLCRVTKVNENGGYSGKIVQRLTKPLKLNAGAKGTLKFQFDELITGEKYFINFYYFSSTGTDGMERATGTSTFIVMGGYVNGDVDGNGIVDVDDVNAIINLILLYDQYKDKYPGNADVDGNGMVDVDDVNTVINIILNQ